MIVRRLTGVFHVFSFPFCIPAVYATASEWLILQGRDRCRCRPTIRNNDPLARSRIPKLKRPTAVSVRKTLGRLIHHPGDRVSKAESCLCEFLLKERVHSQSPLSFPSYVANQGARELTYEGRTGTAKRCCGRSTPVYAYFGLRNSRLTSRLRAELPQARWHASPCRIPA